MRAVVIQVGAIGAVVFLYWQQLFLMLGGLFGRSSAGLRLLRNIALAFLPVVVFGLLLHDLIDQYLFSVWAVVVALVAGAVLMLWAERWREGFASWALSASHHDLFLSRILGALTLCGLVEEARAFLQALEREVHEYRGSHASLPLHHWRLALRG